MTHRKSTPAAKAWVPLVGVEKPFDQTNGTVEFDTEHPEDTTGRDVSRLFAKGVAANAVNVGFGGGL